MGHQRRGHPGRGRRALQPGDDGSRGNGLHPLEAEVRAVSAEQRLRGLREPFMGGIPGQKPKQTLPERTGYFLLMQHGDEVFLSQRPPVGLWGGLFCFPQFADEAELREWLAQRQIKADNLTQLTAFRHTFSHFHLDIVPMWLTVHSSGACMDEGNALWYNLAQPPSVGLAAPVERLLQQLKAGAPV